MAVGGLAISAPAATALTAPRSASPDQVAAPAATSAAAAHVASGQVIVVMRGQATSASVKGVPTAKVATSTAKADQAAVSRSITAGGGKVADNLTLVNAITATISTTEAQRLAADPRVAEIIPNAKIRLPQSTTSPAKAGPAAAGDPAPGYDTTGGIDAPANTCSGSTGDTPATAQLEPEALETTHTDSDQPGAVTARSLGFTGAGVTVAYMAEGIDINNPDFQRDGHSIFTQYKDFSGDGTTNPDGTPVPTAAGEAFLDAGAIAAQGAVAHDISNFSKTPLNNPCYIKVEGEAPGVNLVGLKVFGDTYTTTSGFLQAIQYAVSQKVDVLSESFGGSPMPDTSADVVRLADEAAVKAGTTVVASTGDAGITNTIGSPASDPAVIAAGATTTYRFDLQTGYAAARFPGISGWLDDNISSLSSAGFTSTGRTPDIVAPGELNWGVCTADLTVYEDCSNYAGAASDLSASGGTSESAPIVSGIAALVIEAYKKGHDGAAPTPAQIKTILTSSADDVVAPGEQQGAGQVDAAKAVELAQAFGNHSETGTLPAVSTSANAFVAPGLPGTSATQTETLTNNAAAPQTYNLSARTLGAYTPIPGAQTTVDLEDPGTDSSGATTGSPQYVDFQGLKDNYATQSFNVPAGSGRLEASIAYQAPTLALGNRVRLTLVDPNGDLAAYSLPQGIGNYGHVEVARPVAGTWKAIITSRQGAGGGTTGPVVFGAATANYQSFGTVSPSTLTLQPGGTGKVTVTEKRGTTPGDIAGSLLISSGTPVTGTDAVLGSPDILADRSTTTVPITLRTWIPSKGTTFTQTLTGPNGRDNFPGANFSYQIPVTAGTPSLNVGLTEGSSVPNEAQAFLISPAGDLQALGSNITPSNSPLGGSSISLTKTLAARVAKPAAGAWTLNVQFVPEVNGQELSSPFKVAVSTGATPVKAVHVPNSVKSKYQKGKKFTAQVQVTNNGSTPESYFVDPRTATQVTYSLKSITDPTGEAPTYPGDNVPYYVVPGDTSHVDSTATSTDGKTPIDYDLFSALGDPDLESTGPAVSTSVGYSAPSVVPGEWGITAAQAGPFTTTVTPVPITTTMKATTPSFDTTIDSSTGDLWQVSLDPGYTYNPVTVAPGKTAIISVSFTPRTAGNKKGTLFIDDAQQYVNAYGSETVIPFANQLAAIPFHYTATKNAPKKAKHKVVHHKAAHHKVVHHKAAHRR